MTRDEARAIVLKNLNSVDLEKLQTLEVKLDRQLLPFEIIKIFGAGTEVGRAIKAKATLRFFKEEEPYCEVIE